MIIVVKFEDNEAIYEVPVEKVLTHLKGVTKEQLEVAVKEAIRRT